MVHVRADTWIANVVIVVLVIVASVVVYQHTDARTARAAAETHTWACAYKNGLRQDYLATRAFVIDIKRGLRELPAGFTMTDIRDSQQRRLKRIAETRTLDCS